MVVYKRLKNYAEDSRCLECWIEFVFYQLSGVSSPPTEELSFCKCVTSLSFAAICIDKGFFHISGTPFGRSREVLAP